MALRAHSVCAMLQVMVHQSLLEQVSRDEDLLAFALAHELAHELAQHTVGNRPAHRMVNDMRQHSTCVVAQSLWSAQNLRNDWIADRGSTVPVLQ